LPACRRDCRADHVGSGWDGRADIDPRIRRRGDGGLGSVRGALFRALAVGLVDRCRGSFLPTLLRQVMGGSNADALASRDVVG